MANVINVAELLGELSERSEQLDQQYVFSDEFQKAFHEGQVKSLYYVSMILKKSVVQITPSTTTGNPTIPDQTNDPNFFSTNIQLILKQICACILQLQKVTVFSDQVKRSFHDGQLAEMLSIKKLIESQLYED